MYLCRSPTSQRTWWTPGCRSSSSPCLSAAAPAEPVALSAPRAGGPSSAPHARPAPAASEMSPKKGMSGAPHFRRNKNRIRNTCKTKSGANQDLACTFMWSWALLSRLRVVFLMESEDRGTCFLSCSRQCLSWARLRTTRNNSSMTTDHKYS